MLLRKILGMKVEKLEAVEKLCNQDLHDLYVSPNITMLTDQECGTYGDVGDPQGYKLFLRPTCDWDNVVKCTLNFPMFVRLRLIR